MWCMDGITTNSYSSFAKARRTNGLKSDEARSFSLRGKSTSSDEAIANSADQLALGLTGESELAVPRLPSWELWLLEFSS